MPTKETKLIQLINVLGFDEALRLAPTLTDDADDAGTNNNGKTAAQVIAEKEAAELAAASSKNPFSREHLNLAECGRLLKNPKTQKLARNLAKSAGFPLKESDFLRNDLDAHFAPVRYGQ